MKGFARRCKPTQGGGASVRRQRGERSLRREQLHCGPRAQRVPRQLYRCESDLLIFGADGKVCKLRSRSGQQQGDTLGPFLFCLGIQPILEAAHEKWPALLIRAICDDIHIAGADAEVAEAFDFVKTELEAMGLVLKYGPTKTSCWSPAFPQGTSAEDCAARALCSELPSAVPRLAGGMALLGSFVGTDEFVTRSALAQVENTSNENPRSIRRAAEACSTAALSSARNARDLSGALLRICVVSKVGYLCRTLRPDLAAPALKRADELCAASFSVIYAINRDIFAKAELRQVRCVCYFRSHFRSAVLR